MRRSSPLAVGLVAAALLGPFAASAVGEAPRPGDPRPAVTLDYDRPPMPLRMSRPRYPVEALQQGIEGTVLLELVVDAKGRVAEARVIESVPTFDDAALRSVARWRFSPAFRDGEPVATMVHAPIRFRVSTDEESDREPGREDSAEDPRTKLFGIVYLR